MQLRHSPTHRPTTMIGTAGTSRPTVARPAGPDDAFPPGCRPALLFFRGISGRFGRDGPVRHGNMTSTVQPRIDEIPLPRTAGDRRGRLYAAGFSAVGPDPDSALRRVDADVMICLLTAHEIDLRFPAYADWLGANSTDRARWLPTDDGDVTHDQDVLDLVKDVVTRLEAGDSVITHCGAGMARTAVICILSMIALGADRLSAAGDFRAARPGGGPDGLSQASQIERLMPQITVRTGGAT